MYLKRNLNFSEFSFEGVILITRMPKLIYERHLSGH